MLKFIIWIAGFFEDGNNNSSSKRLSLYVCLFFLWLIVKGSLEGKVINDNVLFIVCGIILFDIGAITSEMFTKIVDNKNASFTKTTVEKSTENTATK